MKAFYCEPDPVIVTTCPLTLTPPHAHLTPMVNEGRTVKGSSTDKPSNPGITPMLSGTSGTQEGCTF